MLIVVLCDIKTNETDAGCAAADSAFFRGQDAPAGR